MKTSAETTRRVEFKTLGCKLNQAETEAIATGFKSLGWELADFGEPADVVVINSCTVTNTADRKTRSAMNQALKIPGSFPDVSDNPEGAKRPAIEAGSPSDSGGDTAHLGEGPLVVMTGCYVDGHRDSLEADGRTYIVGNDHKSRIPELVDAHFKGELLPGHLEEKRDPFGYPTAERVFRTRAMVKVQDGCDNFCTYCIIPLVRGRGISRSIEDSVRAVEEAAASGYREIVLTGVNMSRWSEGDKGFADLVAACLNAPGDFRLRLGSIEPDRIDDELLTLMTHRKMTPHMHLCLQSGSERILLAMRRQYTTKEFRSIAEELRRIPLFNLTTDVIVGFPGESDEDFAETRAMCEALAFGHIHTFPYSRREGTRADRMNNQITNGQKKDRAEQIRRISEKTKRHFRESLVGSTQDVLVERAERAPDGSIEARGLTGNYVPLSFGVPGSRKPEDLQNQLFRVRVTGVAAGDDPDLLGDPDPGL